MAKAARRARHVVLVLGDQLDPHSPALDGFDKSVDVVWMAEVDAEADYVWSTKARIAVFLAAMRHFRDALRRRGFTVDYHALGTETEPTSFASELGRAVTTLQPRKLIALEPGEWRVKEALAQAAKALDVPIEWREGGHFFCTHDEFAEHAEGRKTLRLEYFYREMRRKLDILMDGAQPVGGAWNYDVENRQSFGADGPGAVPTPKTFRPDKLTREVLTLVDTRFASHPGSLARFAWPVTPRQAAAALHDFVDIRLGLFGPFEDAMWTGLPFVYHAGLSSAINLRLLPPRVAVDAAVDALRDGRAPLQSVEGFVRQLIGWREFIRGIYWRFMPDYEHRNAFGHDAPLPPFYWTADTPMHCLRECIGQTLDLGYAHHIQRLMVIGLFAQLLGVDPHEVHRWFLAVYVDAVEWVEMPNVLGMSQFADGGLMASKPYAATGKYIQRMSNYCDDCRFDPAQRTGDRACPFTTLYWDFLMRHDALLRQNRRMGYQVRNVDRIDSAQQRTIRKQADALRSKLVGGESL